jgi:hypothetical protein
MYIEKLDGRYKWYKQGFSYRIAFGVKDLKNLNHWMAVANWLKQTYGRERQLNDKGYLNLNDHYRIDMPSKKCRQVYLRNEQDITMMLLACPE